MGRPNKWINPTKVSAGNNKANPAYSHWRHMLERCSEAYWLKYPTYKGTTYQQSWADYDVFYEWVTNQVGYGLDGIHLDKDLLGDGTVYSEDTCCLLPKSVNIALQSNRVNVGDCPSGVSLNGGKYMASLAYNGKNKNLGRYDSQEEAFAVYRTAKISRIKELATKFKDQIDEKAFDSLINYNRITKGNS